MEETNKDSGTQPQRSQPRNMFCDDFKISAGIEEVTKTKLKSFLDFRNLQNQPTESVTNVWDGSNTDLSNSFSDPTTPTSFSSAPLHTPVTTCDDVCTRHESKDEIRFIFDDFDQENDLSSYIVKRISISVSSNDLCEMKDDITSKGRNDLLCPAPLMISRSCTNVSEQSVQEKGATRRKLSRKISNIFSRSNTSLNNEKLRLQKEREILSQVQNELRSKLPKTFQVTATLFANPQILENTNAKTSSKANPIEPKTRLRSPSIPFVRSFKKVTGDESDAVTFSSWRSKLRKKFKLNHEKKCDEKGTPRYKEDLIQDVTQVEYAKNPSSTTPEQLKSLSTDHSINSEKKTEDTRGICISRNLRHLSLNPTTKHIYDSRPERESISSVDSGIGLKNAESLNFDDGELEYDFIAKEQKRSSDAALYINKNRSSELRQRKQGLPTINTATARQISKR